MALIPESSFLLKNICAKVRALGCNPRAKFIFLEKRPPFLFCKFVTNIICFQIECTIYDFSPQKVLKTATFRLHCSNSIFEFYPVFKPKGAIKYWERLGDALRTHWGRIGDALETHWGRIRDALGTH